MNLGFPEMMFIFILALIIFGPKKLPEIGRQIGKGLAEFKRASREFQSQIEDEVRKLELEADIKNTIAPISLTDTVSSQPPALTVGSAPSASETTTASSASTPEVAAAAAHPDYTVEHLPASSSLPKADSAANA
ncbi:MAG TPA: TatA/E family twin arginine-targeting protein translocase [Terriglobales bacterium]|nr:TatA/E family twin arginine-targeting protein translocase [Terriglobales bacterium]